MERLNFQVLNKPIRNQQHSVYLLRSFFLACLMCLCEPLFFQGSRLCCQVERKITTPLFTVQQQYEKKLNRETTLEREGNKTKGEHNILHVPNRIIRQYMPLLYLSTTSHDVFLNSLSGFPVKCNEDPHHLTPSSSTSPR